MRYSFTGTRKITLAHAQQVLWPVLDTLTDGTEYTTGCARGTDSWAAIHLALAYPDALHRLVVPAAPCNDLLGLFAEPHYPTPVVVYMPPAKDNRTAYRQRDQYMVGVCDELLAFPLYPEHDGRSRYSGTWLTVRLARKAGVPYRVWVLEPSTAVVS